jgi:hypothetical protein
MEDVRDLVSGERISDSVEEIMNSAAKARSLLLATISPKNKYIPKHERIYFAQVIEMISTYINAYRKNEKLKNIIDEQSELMNVQTESLHSLHESEKDIEKSIGMEKVTARMEEFEESKLPTSDQAFYIIWTLLLNLYNDDRIKGSDPVIFLNDKNDGKEFDFYELKWLNLSCIICDERISVYGLSTSTEQQYTKKIFIVPVDMKEQKKTFKEASNFILSFLAKA